MYAEGNPKTKKALKAAVAAGPVRVFSPGPFPVEANGVEYLEGPHYPEPHRWYAKVAVTDGVITKVLS